MRITTLVLNKKPPRRKEDTLSGKLAPAIFQVINNLFYSITMFYTRIKVFSIKVNKLKKKIVLCKSGLL